MIGFGQNVNIPDANFKTYLLGNSLINTNGDSEIQISEANSFSGIIDCLMMNISDLTGIENFTALTALSCGANQLTSLDVSNNTALTDLYCNYNQLTSLDVSNNNDLFVLHCQGNQLTSLDVSQNTALTYLICHTNQLTSLDMSNNTALIYLDCYVNYIECLDISNNLILTDLNCRDNLLTQLNTKNGNWQNMDVEASSNNLTCVEVDNIGYASNNWIFDSFTTLSTNCNYTNPCNTTSSINEEVTNKNLIKTINILGVETKCYKNQPLLYIYNDGTVKKRIVIE
ncbi:MAG: hypothetical protein CMP71_04025 [Flavobacteriales bacterium]|nr:hypothetical protein [Flavobacteriales bacterium]